MEIWAIHKLFSSFCDPILSFDIRAKGTVKPFAGVRNKVLRTTVLAGKDVVAKALFMAGF